MLFRPLSWDTSLRCYFLVPNPANYIPSWPNVLKLYRPTFYWKTLLICFKLKFRTSMTGKNQMMWPSFFMYLWLRNVPYFISSAFYRFRCHSQIHIFWFLDRIIISLLSPPTNHDCPLTWLKLIWKAVTRSAMCTSANDLAFYELDMKAPVFDPFTPNSLKMLWPVVRWMLSRYPNKSYSSPTTGFLFILPSPSPHKLTVWTSLLPNITWKLVWTNSRFPLLVNFDLINTLSSPIRLSKLKTKLNRSNGT